MSVLHLLSLSPSIVRDLFLSYKGSFFVSVNGGQGLEITDPGIALSSSFSTIISSKHHGSQQRVSYHLLPLSAGVSLLESGVQQRNPGQ